MLGILYKNIIFVDLNGRCAETNMLRFRGRNKKKLHWRPRNRESPQSDFAVSQILYIGTIIPLAWIPYYYYHNCIDMVLT